MTIQEIKAYMKANKITQIELAERSGLPLQTLRKIFCGNTQNPRIDTMQAIEHALGLDQAAEPPPQKEKAAPLTDKQERLLAAFDKLIPPMQDYILNSVEALVDSTGDTKNKRA